LYVCGSAGVLCCRTTLQSECHPLTRGPTSEGSGVLECIIDVGKRGVLEGIIDGGNVGLQRGGLAMVKRKYTASRAPEARG